ncbi:hypothetical protein L1F30_16515 [Simiduia sp. 21SJ11W-1]|uniref:replication protein P n=1 Tax=Simiduia sp. 21SJ11W-1 TaxID=2909669 RepID=UPI0020A006A9|nr:replication protein P [Simiduia sp. 21SJ11W-1]UTA47745.1 hypothetical protein L1F30_16515 [Simiduia sp. 21SJ11W-1]
MQDSKTLLNQAEHAIAQSANSSQTEAGRSDQTSKPGAAHIDAINQVFELFRLNYHNQYFAAFPDLESLNLAKRLWLESLAGFEPEVILRGAKRVIQQSDYLPTVHKMLVACEGDNRAHGLPDVHAAYVEACNAPSPKADQHWSHPAVYLAGKASDWYFLANNPERTALPVFTEHYKNYCDQVRKGLKLALPERKALPETIERPLSKDENLARLDALKKQIGLD